PDGVSRAKVLGSAPAVVRAQRPRPRLPILLRLLPALQTGCCPARRASRATGAGRLALPASTFRAGKGDSDRAGRPFARSPGKPERHLRRRGRPTIRRELDPLGLRSSGAGPTPNPCYHRSRSTGSVRRDRRQPTVPLLDGPPASARAGQSAPPTGLIR